MKPYRLGRPMLAPVALVSTALLALQLAGAITHQAHGPAVEPQRSYFERHLEELFGSHDAGLEAAVNAQRKAEAAAIADGASSLYMEWKVQEGRRLASLNGNGQGNVAAIQPPPLTNPPVMADYNITFCRHQSVSEPAWVDWRVSPVVATVVYDQGQCESCWVVASADVIAMLFAIVNRLANPVPLSPQHVCDCGLKTCCAGGWPEWTFTYSIANKGLAPLSLYPYIGKDGQSCKNVPPGQLSGLVSGWEKIPAKSSLALRKTVTQHPAVAFIYASPSFLAYKSGIFTGSDCDDDADANHALIIMGYNLSSTDPYWIAKNSWGTGWGEGGFVRILMRLGRPVCGLGVEPSLYPHMFQLMSPCSLPYSPCGAGSCYVSNGQARCNCPAGFVERLEVVAPKCVPAYPCSANPNPCGFGTCNNAFDGSYTCDCPSGTVIGVGTGGTMTCIVNSFQSGLQTYISLEGDNCTTLTYTFGITQQSLQTQNPFLNCSSSITPGTVIIVAGAESGLGCSSMDVVQPGDSCSAIATRNDITVAQLLAINANLNCATLRQSQTVCVLPGQLAPSSDQERSCGATYTTTDTDNCLSIVNELSVSLITLQWLNPGIDCTANVLPPMTLCTSTLVLTRQSVSCTQYYAVKQGDTCGSIAANYGLTRAAFLQLNPGTQCFAPRWVIGMAVCVVGTFTPVAQLTTPLNMVPYYVQANDTGIKIAQKFSGTCFPGAANDTVAMTQFALSICASNSLPSCLDNRWVVVGMMIFVPCLKNYGTSTACQDYSYGSDIPVCGIDKVTYKSYSCALQALAVWGSYYPTYSPCAPSSQYCVARAGAAISTTYGFLPAGCTTDYTCPYPVFPDVAYTSQACTSQYPINDQCELYYFLCAGAVNMTKSPSFYFRQCLGVYNGSGKPCSYTSWMTKPCSQPNVFINGGW